MSVGKLFNSAEDDDLDLSLAQEQSSSNNDEECNEEQQQLDAELEEAQFRINLGNYYAVLVKKGGIFKDGSKAAKCVDEEVSAFARERMATLLNLSSAPKPKIELPFNQEQIQILIFLANRYLEKQQSIPTTKAPDTAKPTLAPVSVPPVPTIQTLPSPSTSKPEATSPIAAQAQTPKKPKPAVRKLKEATEGAIVEQDGEYQRYVSDAGILVAMPFPDGEVFEYAGKHWKYVTNPETGKRLKMSVSLKKQVTPPNRLPMPDERAYGNLSAMQASNQVNNPIVNQSEKRRDQ